MKLLLVVACALIDKNNRILLGQRKKGDFQGLWEFPGGKPKHEENPEEALIREIHEELGITLHEESLKPFSFISQPYKDFHLLLPLYTCQKWEGTPTAQEDQLIAWVDKDALLTYPMPPADERLRIELLKDWPH
jgi:8-oxo-dGTP diphosphatase